MGFTQVYTGDGKGKTTAALGLLLRAVGSGMSVYLGQFFKSESQSELVALKKLSKCLNKNQLLTFKLYGSEINISNKVERRDIESAISGYNDIKYALFSGTYDMVIADEINVVINLGIIDENEILDLIDKNKGTEFVLTGRCAKKSIIEKANLVSEVKKVKHYCDLGLIPRIGIEK